MSNISAISWREQATFDEMIISTFNYNSVLTSSWIFIVLAHWNNTLQVDMSLHLDQSLLFLFNDAWWMEKQQIPIIQSFGLIQPGFEPTIYPHINMIENLALSIYTICTCIITKWYFFTEETKQCLFIIECLWCTWDIICFSSQGEHSRFYTLYALYIYFLIHCVSTDL